MNAYKCSQIVEEMEAHIEKVSLAFSAIYLLFCMDSLFSLVAFLPSCFRCMDKRTKKSVCHSQLALLTPATACRCIIECVGQGSLERRPAQEQEKT